jgi:hypothetical protein
MTEKYLEDTVQKLGNISRDLWIIKINLNPLIHGENLF